MATAVHNRPGAKAHARMVRMSASKARVVLNLVRGKQITEANEILSFSERLAADVIQKCLASAVANAEHNDGLNADELFVSACYADEGPTLKRFRPRARGRAGRIHKQTCHITVEVSRYSEDELEVRRISTELKSEGRANRSQTKAKSDGGDRAKRVAKSQTAATEEVAEDLVEDTAAEEIVEEVAETTDAVEEVAEDTAAEVAEDTAAEAAEETAAEVKETAEDAVDEEATDEVVSEEETTDDAGENQ
ncbi:MAG: 50S ribosomal protein L22 [Acidimicrobiales bacterium]